MSGNAISRCKLFEDLIIDLRGMLLTYGVVIATHDPCKAYKFRHVKLFAAWVQLLEIEFVLENLRDLGDLTLLQTDVGVVDPGKKVRGMTVIGFQDTRFSFFGIARPYIGNTEIVRKHWDAWVRCDQTLELRDRLFGPAMRLFVEIA